MANVLASVAAYENEIRGGRIRAGQAVARNRGKRWGGSKKGRRLKVTQEQVRTIQRLRSEGAEVTANRPRDWLVQADDLYVTFSTARLCRLGRSALVAC
jgi:DNA invertase Pin-like site-specific DNA recombinase